MCNLISQHIIFDAYQIQLPHIVVGYCKLHCSQLPYTLPDSSLQQPTSTLCARNESSLMFFLQNCKKYTFAYRTGYFVQDLSAQVLTKEKVCIHRQLGY